METMLCFGLQSISGFCIHFESSDLNGVGKDYIQFIEAYLPGVTLEENSYTEQNFNVFFKESKLKKLMITSTSITILDTWNKKVSLDLWHLLYSLFRENLLKNNLYSTHAVCIGKEKNILLVGHTGTGKTTLMMTFVNDLGWKIFSGNKTIIDINNGILGVGGTKTITIRDLDIDKYPNLSDLTANYSNRTSLTLESKHIQRETSVEISAIFVIKVEPGADKCVETGFPSNMHTLFPYFLDTVYADTVMCDGNDVYSADVSVVTKTVLAKKLKENLAHAKVFSLAGSTDYLIGEIQKLI